MDMLPDIGQVVLYALTEGQADEITRRRRESAGGVASRLKITSDPGARFG